MICSAEWIALMSGSNESGAFFGATFQSEIQVLFVWYNLLRQSSGADPHVFNCHLLRSDSLLRELLVNGLEQNGHTQVGLDASGGCRLALWKADPGMTCHEEWLQLWSQEYPQQETVSLCPERQARISPILKESHKKMLNFLFSNGIQSNNLSINHPAHQKWVTLNLKLPRTPQESPKNPRTPKNTPSKRRKPKRPPKRSPWPGPSAFAAGFSGGVLGELVVAGEVGKLPRCGSKWDERWGKMWKNRSQLPWMW